MAKPRSLLIAADHGGFSLKQALIRMLPDFSWEDLGPADDVRVDYPDYAEKLSGRISSGKDSRGILICGSGIGMCIAANKFPGVRAARVGDPVSARLSREHNDANILCLGARFLAPEYAAEIVRIWVDTPFSKDARHQERIRKITQLEKKS